MVTCIQWNQEMVNIPQKLYTLIWRKDWENIGMGRCHWYYIQVIIILSWIIIRYQRLTSNKNSVQDDCEMIWQKTVIEIITPFSLFKGLNWQWNWRLHILILQRPCKKTDKLLLHNYWQWNIIKYLYINCLLPFKKGWIKNTFWANEHLFWWKSSLYWCNMWFF